jgi:beta-glucanase (GH16 family)
MLGNNCQETNKTTPNNVSPCSWPNPGSDEIDIAERLGYSVTSINQQIHRSTGNPGCSSVAVTDISQNFHRYGFAWSPGSAKWTIDDVETCSVTTSVPSTAMFLILQTAVGGIGGGAVHANTLPQTMSVDEVTIWQEIGQ